MKKAALYCIFSEIVHFFEFFFCAWWLPIFAPSQAAPALHSLGVKSLGTGYTESDHVDKSGNEHRQVGSYTKTDGTTAKMTDVWFVTNSAATTYDDSDIPAHSAAIKALPDLAGRGRLYGLRDAMALDDAKDAKGNSRLVAPYYQTTRTEERSLREMVAAFVETDADGDPLLSRGFGATSASPMAARG